MIQHVGTVQGSKLVSEAHQMPAILCNCTVLKSQFYPSQLLRQGWVQLQCTEDLRLVESGHDDGNKSSATTLMIGGAWRYFLEFRFVIIKNAPNEPQTCGLPFYRATPSTMLIIPDLLEFPSLRHTSVWLSIAIFSPCLIFPSSYLPSSFFHLTYTSKSSLHLLSDSTGIRRLVSG
jgi:hypothetical protein